MDSIFFYRNPATAPSNGGSLKDLKIAIQPNMSVAGWPADAGSNALINFTALEDATIVKRLCQAGARICGSTRMSEFGFGLHKSWAGRALQQKAADAELVIDMTGECRLAASRAGVYCLKPSYGLVSRFGLIDLIPSMECCGILSCNLENIRNVLKTIAGPDTLDFSLPDENIPDWSCRIIGPESTTIGLITEAQDTLSDAQREAFLTGIEGLKKAGFKLVELSLSEFALFSLVHKIVGSVEASSCAGRYDSVRYGKRAPGAKNWNDMYLSSRSSAFGPLLKSYLFQGSFFQFERYEAYENACRIRARLLKNMQQITARADFLILPLENSMPADGPVSLAEIYTQFASTVFANVTGQPALYLPPSGSVQAGFQLSGPRLSDSRLLALGEYLMHIRQGGQ